LVPVEVYEANPYAEIFSTSIALPPEKGGFRANGKGRNRDFSLASAYAEYMERLQNLLFATFPRSVAQTLKSEFQHFYFPDETYMSRDAFSGLPQDILADFIRYSGQGRSEFINVYFDRLIANGLPGVVAVPFYDTTHRCLQHLPFNLLLLTVGSNGMAAGNTRAEAVFQALCEIMERWAGALVYYDQLTPPTVADTYLDRFPEERAIIREIERDRRYQVIVKDFSAGRLIPAVGVIIHKLDTDQYRLNVGSDTSFQVALSRCLTEIYQGFQNAEQFDAALLPVPRSVPDYFRNHSNEARFERFQNFTLFTRDNSGPFPPSLFGDTPDYAFDPAAWTPQGSYVKEVQRLVRFFHRHGRNVYIRDVSSLGFPTVFVYVPEVSAQGRKSAPAVHDSGTFQVVDLDAAENLLFNLDVCSPDELARVAKYLSSLDLTASVVQLFNIELAGDAPWRQVTVAFLLSQIHYCLGNYEAALEFFDHFVESRPDRVPYYALVHQYLQAKAVGVPAAVIHPQLAALATKEGWQTEMVEQVTGDMCEPYRLNAFTRLPVCPNCPGCPLSDCCQTRHKLHLARIVYANMQIKSQIEALEWVSCEA
jgi:YcaO-like protein with predicted kinase domain